MWTHQRVWSHRGRIERQVNNLVRVTAGLDGLLLPHSFGVIHGAGWGSDVTVLLVAYVRIIPRVSEIASLVQWW